MDADRGGRNTRRRRRRRETNHASILLAGGVPPELAVVEEPDVAAAGAGASQGWPASAGRRQMRSCPTSLSSYSPYAGPAAAGSAVSGATILSFFFLGLEVGTLTSVTGTTVIDHHSMFTGQNTRRSRFHSTLKQPLIYETVPYCW
jgi:hypothetical protein